MALVVDLVIFHLVYFWYFKDAFDIETGALIAQCISWFCGINTSFYFNKKYTFKDTTEGRKDIGFQVSRFYVVAISAITIRSVIIYMIFKLEDWYTISNWPVISSIVNIFTFELCALLTAIAIITIYDFILVKKVVYLRQE